MPESPHDDAYYAMRRIRLDRRGPLSIHPESHWGFDVTVITASHDLLDWFKGAKPRPVTVGAYAWICSNVVLFNCIIGEGAIVAVGSVVRSCEVKPWTMVAGNPPEVIAHCPDCAPDRPWVYVAEKWRVLE